MFPFSAQKELLALTPEAPPAWGALPSKAQGTALSHSVQQGAGTVWDLP